ncbi:diguanylate cyclase [Flavonifractor sp. An112]|uniref:nitroreductase family protein n=1 Tax=Flavonifractor sp. An112 TaxID=1965544 RepID=UPI000B382818|nr:nitroreductase [Flavonifractor sp. An112]OUQ61357.1 diguanylate cyclase [Flavonifractor sp. An112]
MNHEEMLTLIKTRRSCRSYRPDAVPEDVLDKVLEAGTYAPTGGGRQSPVIIAVRDSKLRSELSAMNAEIMGGDSDPYYGAPVVVLVLAEGNTFVEDGTCVLENLMLAAHAMGLATVWVHREREMFDNEKGKALLREWGLPETLRGVGAVALGYAAQEPVEAAPRKQNYIVKL